MDGDGDGDGNDDEGLGSVQMGLRKDREGGWESEVRLG